MKKTDIIMGMPIAVEIVQEVPDTVYDEVFAYFRYVDSIFSTYLPDSEISRIKRGELQSYSGEVKEIFDLAEATKKETNGYFDIYHDGILDPSGIVKGWAISNAAKLLETNNVQHFSINAGGDIQVKGQNAAGSPWKVGIQNPWNLQEVVKVLSLENKGIATSGLYMRGQHIYNPVTNTVANTLASVTVVADSVYDADRFATAAFVMGNAGAVFLEKQDGVEGYIIDNAGIATYTNGFASFIQP